MCDEFLKKYNNNEYISNLLYSRIEKEYKEIIPDGFDIELYNQNVLNKKYEENKYYFDNMFSDIDVNIHLDEEQIKAIIADEDYSLIIAGAGTGKTTTMVAKAKYLVDKMNIEPEKILVMSYTKKATQELYKRIVLDMGIPVEVTTFHSLGYKIIKKLYSRHLPYIVDENLRKEIFLDYFKELFEDKDRLKNIIRIFDKDKLNKRFVFSKGFLNDYEKYNKFDQYFEAYYVRKKNEAIYNFGRLRDAVEYMIDKSLNRETPTSIQGEVLKSNGEAQIANFLFINNIEYKYEKVYDEIMPDNKIYRPDFTINVGGEEIYIEYFGLSNYSDEEMSSYDKIRKMKENYHNKHHNKFIKIDYIRGIKIEEQLQIELEKLGVKLEERSIDEIYYTMLSTNKTAEFFPFMELYYEIIDKIKGSQYRNDIEKVCNNYISTLDGEERSMAIQQYNEIVKFYNYYQSRLYGSTSYGFDYSDLIYYARENITDLGGSLINYKHLIIDEYQDISLDRYLLTSKLVNMVNAKVTAVGDDWQTIFSFAGSNIQYIYDFQEYFPNSKIFKITNTYRNSQSLVDYAGKFIMKNKSQQVKELKSFKEIEKPIKFIPYDENEEIEVLKRIINDIHSNSPNHSILILSRLNKNINNLYNDEFFIDDVDTKIKIRDIDNIDINGMSIHKSKGLTSDEVIVIGLDNNFPLSERQDFWLIDIFKNKLKQEEYPYAEERRIFYVALTRTKNNVYLLTAKNDDKRSPFLDELRSIIDGN